MITIILFGLIGLYICYIEFWRYVGFYFTDIVTTTLLTAFIVLLSMLLGLLVALSLPMKTETIMNEYKIVALQDNNSTSGNFYLGSGQINSEMKYVFYCEEEDGFKMKQANFEHTVIKYSDTIKCEVYREIEVKSFINYFALDCSVEEENLKHIIYIPKGSIKSNYSLDAQ